MLRGVYRHDGVLLPGTRNDDGRGDNRSPRHTLRFNKTGTYYLSATHEWNRYAEGGTFELSLADLGTFTKTCTEVDVDNLTYEPGHFDGT